MSYSQISPHQTFLLTEIEVGSSFTKEIRGGGLCAIGDQSGWSWEGLSPPGYFWGQTELCLMQPLALLVEVSRVMAAQSDQDNRVVFTKHMGQPMCKPLKHSRHFHGAAQGRARPGLSWTYSLCPSPSSQLCWSKSGSSLKKGRLKQQESSALPPSKWQRLKKHNSAGKCAAW